MRNTVEPFSASVTVILQKFYIADVQPTQKVYFQSDIKRTYWTYFSRFVYSFMQYDIKKTFLIGIALIYPSKVRIICIYYRIMLDGTIEGLRSRIFSFFIEHIGNSNHNVLLPNVHLELSKIFSQNRIVR